MALEVPSNQRLCLWMASHEQKSCRSLTVVQRVSFIVPTGQLKLSIDAHDRVLLLHSEYVYVQAPQGQRGWSPAGPELDRHGVTMACLFP